MAVRYNFNFQPDTYETIFDVGNRRSYPGTGNVLFNLKFKNNNTLTFNNATVEQNYLVYNGTNTISILSNDINLHAPYNRNISFWFYPFNVTKTQILYSSGNPSQGVQIYLSGGRVYGYYFNNIISCLVKSPPPSSFCLQLGNIQTNFATYSQPISTNTWNFVSLKIPNKLFDYRDTINFNTNLNLIRDPLSSDSSFSLQGTGIKDVLSQFSFNYSFFYPVTGDYDEVHAGQNFFIAKKGKKIFGKSTAGGYILNTAAFTSEFTEATGNWDTIKVGSANVAAMSGKDLYVSGNNFSGQLGLGDNNNRLGLQQVPGEWEHVVLGYAPNMFVLSADKKTWYATGDNSTGQFGLGDFVNRNTLTPLTGNWDKISPTSINTLALSGNKVFVAGITDFLGFFSPQFATTFQQITGNWDDITGGASHSFLTSAGKIFGFGEELAGELALKNPPVSNSTYRFIGINNIQECLFENVDFIHPGFYATHFFKDNRLFAVGVNDGRVLGEAANSGFVQTGIFGLVFATTTPFQLSGFWAPANNPQLGSETFFARRVIEDGESITLHVNNVPAISSFYVSTLNNTSVFRPLFPQNTAINIGTGSFGITNTVTNLFSLQNANFRQQVSPSPLIAYNGRISKIYLTKATTPYETISRTFNIDRRTFR
jgi:hypothetical protein